MIFSEAHLEYVRGLEDYALIRADVSSKTRAR